MNEVPMEMDRTDTQPMKTMTPREFRDLGLLQEINRRFLHPMGLALSVDINTEGVMTFSNEVWDYRGDPEGMRFVPPSTDSERLERCRKAYDVDLLFHAKEVQRWKTLGYHIQPIGMRS